MNDAELHFRHRPLLGQFLAAWPLPKQLKQSFRDMRWSFRALKVLYLLHSIVLWTLTQKLQRWNPFPHLCFKLDALGSTYLTETLSPEIICWCLNLSMTHWIPCVISSSLKSNLWKRSTMCSYVTSDNFCNKTDWIINSAPFKSDSAKIWVFRCVY